MYLQGPPWDDGQLKWSTPVTFTWKFKDVADVSDQIVAAGRALGKRTLPLPRVLRPPLVAACLPRLITSTRVLSCMQRIERAVCRSVALLQVKTASIIKARFAVGGASHE